MKAKFQIYKSTERNYYFFRLIDESAEIILRSEAYTTISACKNGVEAVKINSIYRSKYDSKMATNGKHYFNLKASNGQVIGTSKLYLSMTVRDKRIDLVQRIAESADLEDLSD
ncbi:MAG: YegP family protein [Oleispira sp.]|nr:YegP family protein [Oleispira sp.]